MWVATTEAAEAAPASPAAVPALIRYTPPTFTASPRIAWYMSPVIGLTAIPVPCRGFAPDPV